MKKFFNKISIFIRLLFLSPVLILLIFTRFFLRIKIIEIETRAIGHYAYTMEIFLSEIKNNIHGNNIYLAFRNKTIANKFLYDRIKKNFIIVPRIILEPIFKFFNTKLIYTKIGKYFLSDYRHWTQNYTHENPSQLIDIYGVLEKTPPTIIFTKEENIAAYSKIKEININENDEFVCIHPRTPHFALSKNRIDDLVFQLRDSREFNFSKTINYLNEKNIKSVFLGHSENNLKFNDKIIYYNKSSIKNGFIDIFLLSKCKYLIGDSSGMSMAPLMFRKRSLYTNVSELHSMSFIDSIYKPIIIMKKFKLLQTNEYLPYSFVLKKKLSEVDNVDILNKLGYDIEDNSEDELLNATNEMDYLIDNKEYLDRDINLEKKFNDILIRYNYYPLQKSKISHYFLKKNIDLLN